MNREDNMTLEHLRQRRRELADSLWREQIGMAVLTPKARKLMSRIDEVDRRIHKLSNPTHLPLSELLPEYPEKRKEIYRLLTAIPLAADLVYDLLVQLRDAVNSLGVDECTFTGLIDKLRAQVERIVFMVTPDMKGLHSVLEQDNPLIADLEMIINRYINESGSIPEN